jgi:uncharacterized protein (TIGR02118 family)
MAKLVAMYKKPENPAEFDDRYFNGHVPLAKQIPGLKHMEVAKVSGSPAGESEWYLIAELYFDSMDALKSGLASPEGKAAGKDAMSFAKDIITMLFAEEQKVPVGAGK